MEELGPEGSKAGGSKVKEPEGDADTQWVLTNLYVEEVAHVEIVKKRCRLSSMPP